MWRPPGEGCGLTPPARRPRGNSGIMYASPPQGLQLETPSIIDLERQLALSGLERQRDGADLDDLGASFAQAWRCLRHRNRSSSHLRPQGPLGHRGQGDRHFRQRHDEGDRGDGVRATRHCQWPPARHCEARRAEAIHGPLPAAWMASRFACARGRNDRTAVRRHCEARRAEAIHRLRPASWIASPSARNDG